MEYNEVPNQIRELKQNDSQNGRIASYVIPRITKPMSKTVQVLFDGNCVNCDSQLVLDMLSKQSERDCKEIERLTEIHKTLEKLGSALLK